MVFPAYAFSSGFVRTSVEFTSCCKAQFIVKSRTTRRAIVSLSNSQDDHRVPEDANLRNNENSDMSAANSETNFSASSRIVENSSADDDYKAFNKLLGLESETLSNEPVPSGRREYKRSSVEERKTNPEATSAKVEWGESANINEIDPSEYEVFDQLLKSARGTQRKLVKGSKPYSSTFRTRRTDVSTDASAESASDRSDVETAKPQSFNEYPSEGSEELGNQLSPAESYAIMREQFGDGFHSDYPKPDSSVQRSEETEKKVPPILSERPRYPGTSTPIKESTILESDTNHEKHTASRDPDPLPRPELKKPPQRPISPERLLNADDTLASEDLRGSAMAEGTSEQNKAVVSDAVSETVDSSDGVIGLSVSKDFGTENMGPNDELIPPNVPNEFVKRNVDLESQLTSLKERVDRDSTFRDGFEDESNRNKVQLSPRPKRTGEPQDRASSLSSGIVRESPRRRRRQKHWDQTEAHILRDPKIVENII